MVPYYVDDWALDPDDVGSTLLSLFSELAGEVTERLDRVPEKHRVEFFETLGFERLPPQPSRLPLSVEVADRAGGNVVVPAGTVAKATATDGSEQLFEVPEGGTFDATPSNVRSVFSLDPDDDAIYAHHGAVGGGSTTTLFGPRDSEDLQEHALYVGDPGRLSVGPGSSLRVELETDADWALLDGTLRWEYHGERTVGEETVEGWHPFPSQVDFSAMVRDVDASDLESVLAEHGYDVDDLLEHAPDVVRRQFPTLAEEIDQGGKPTSGSRSAPDAPDGVVALEFDPDGIVTPATVDGVESKWIRGRLPLDVPRSTREELFAVTVDSRDSSPAYAAPLRVGARSESLRPEIMLHNDVPLDPAPIRPFGTWPRQGDAFYVASTDALTKPGATVTVTFLPDTSLNPGDAVRDREASDPDPAVVIETVEETAEEWIVYGDETVADQNRRYGYAPDEPVVLVAYEQLLDADWDGWRRADPDDLFEEVMAKSIKFHAFPKSRLERVEAAEDDPHDPSLSWEYFDGEGWSNLAAAGRTFEDGTSRLQHGGAVTFTVPDDLAETTVGGHDGHWFRVRLVGGGYGELRTEPIAGTSPTQFRTVEDFDPPSFDGLRIAYEQVAAPDHVRAANNLDFGPDLAADEVERYRPFEGVPTNEQAIYLGFDGPLTDGPINILIDLADAAYPPGFHPRVRWEYHDVTDDVWRRLDVRDGTESLTERGIVGLVIPEASEPSRALGRDHHWVRARVTGEPFGIDSGDGAPDATTERSEASCGRYVETVPPSGEPRPYRPSVEGLYPNAVWVRNRRTIAGEVLGSSDGTVNQTFAVSTPPVVGGAVWVDELGALSEGRRETLAEQWPDRTDLATDADGEPVAFWIRWERQPDLLDSGPDDRHYVLDAVGGTVTFGDGARGRIPPRGSDNIRANYETGGGEAGNVTAGAVTGFRQSLAFVESVTNPLPGAAGADAEPTGAVTRRAAQQLRDGDRAVAPTDLERAVRDASREIARVRCLPGMDKGGRFRPGWVTLLVVPDTVDEKPLPSTTLRETIAAALSESAPVTLVEMDQLVVRGPSYVSVSVDSELAATGGSVSQLEERARAAVRSYIHPLTGGPSGGGWRFGELPCRSDFFELLEELDGVDHVERLSLQFETSQSLVTVTEGDEVPDTAADALAYAGTQDITATLVDQGGARD